MELLKLISDRYSCRRYSQEVVKDEDILKILEAGRIAPTAHNNQPQRIYVVKSEEGKEKLMKDFKFNFKAPCYLVCGYNIDEAWKENLRELDDLRQSVQNASYEQKDPLLIYKLESFNLFKAMIETINSKVTAILMRGQIPIREPEQVHRAEAQRRSDYSRYRAQKDEYSAGSRQQNPNDPTRQDTREQQITQPIRVEKTVGRNDPCPCGSGKKYKNCHGKA